MNTPIKCADCRHSYDGADSILRCRLTGRPAEVGCVHFDREPGADAEERDPSRVWFCDKLGRGD